MRKLVHIGIPVKEKRDGMVRVPEMRIYLSDPKDSKNNIEWLYFEPDCMFPKMMQEMTHVAYEVDDIEAELKGARILLPLGPLGDNARFAYIVEEGMPVELIQYNK